MPVLAGMVLVDVPGQSSRAIEHAGTVLALNPFEFVVLEGVLFHLRFSLEQGTADGTGEAQLLVFDGRWRGDVQSGQCGSFFRYRFREDALDDVVFQLSVRVGGQVGQEVLPEVEVLAELLAAEVALKVLVLT